MCSNKSINIILEKYIPLIEDGEIQDKLKNLYIQLYEHFPLARGGDYKHQTWDGGYYDHILDCLSIGEILHKNLNRYKSLGFTFSDVVIVLLLHDLEKPYKQYGDKSSSEEIKEEIMNSYHIDLKEEYVNALKYIHGEGDDYSLTERIVGSLGALCHCVDTISARIYYDK